MSSLALKFGFLVIRTISKPIANTIKSQAKQHPKFRKACISFAQHMHRADAKLRVNLLGDPGLRVRPLNDTKAIENGANFISETFIFSVAGGLLLYENLRARRKEAARQESVADDIRVIQNEIGQLKQAFEKLNAEQANKRIKQAKNSQGTLSRPTSGMEQSTSEIEQSSDARNKDRAVQQAD